MAVSEEKYQAALARLRRMRQQGMEAVMTVVESAETVGTAGGLSFIDGYFGKDYQHKDPAEPSSHGVLWFGVPFQMYVGTLFHGVGALGLASEHCHAVGNGAFSSGVSRLAYESGKHRRVVHDTMAGAPKGAGASGVRYPLRSMSAGRRSYSDAELEQIARGHA
jgi:hypothetical protein